MTRKSNPPLYASSSGGVVLNHPDQDDHEFDDGLKVARWQLFRVNNRGVDVDELYDKFKKCFGYTK